MSSLRTSASTRALEGSTRRTRPVPMTTSSSRMKISTRSKVVGFSEDDDSEEIRRSWMVKRKKDFQKMEKVHGRLVNILEGLGLHAGVFSPAEQKQIVDCIYVLQKKGRNGELRERTYSEPRKWSSSDNNSVRLLLQLRSGQEGQLSRHNSRRTSRSHF
ncbi:RNA demethylase ALKBH9B-like [Zingiber officinale]|uniref:RNA demethylase ALKBH9B-like n=1 Tax=Zingiber officinale TaxID=94328 RepID=UPI001C4B2433|nr:RNA demethylase ALKBH9B-like [Zingiber officinale]